MTRAPEVFSLNEAPAADKPKRAPSVKVIESEDVFAEVPSVVEAPPPAQRSLWLRLFLGASGAFLSLALTTWAYNVIADLAAKWPPLGYLAMGLAGLAVLALLVLAGKEIAALARLGSAARLRVAAEAAHAAGTAPEAKEFINKINAFYAGDASTARGRAALEAHTREIIDPPQLLLLAEHELLAEKDRQARAVIAQAASRVAMVTSLSPRAWVDIVFVTGQGIRLISRLAGIYSGRPGGVAVWRLAARVVSHLAVTGGVAVANDALGQLLGAGLAARLSSKLGEGVLNGVLTARVGLSAIAVCRPMPFRAFEPPKLSDVAGALLTPKAEPAKSAD